MNLYSYVQNNPIVSVDPSGLSSCKINGCCNCEKKKIIRNRETGITDTEQELFWDVIIEQQAAVAAYAGLSWAGVPTPPASPHTVMIGLLYHKEQWVKEECTRERCLDFLTYPLYYDCKEIERYWVYDSIPDGIWETYWY